MDLTKACTEVVAVDCQCLAPGIESSSPQWVPCGGGSLTVCSGYFIFEEDARTALQRVLQQHSGFTSGHREL